MDRLEQAEWERDAARRSANEWQIRSTMAEVHLAKALALVEALRWIAAGKTGSFGSAAAFAKDVLGRSDSYWDTRHDN